MNIASYTKATRVMVSQAAGTGTTNGSSVDMGSDFQVVTFVFEIGDISASGTVDCKVQQSSDDGAGDAFTDLKNTKISYGDTDDDRVAIISVGSPGEEFLRPVVVRSTANSEIDSVMAYQGKVRPAVFQHDTATVLRAEYHQAPAEGTA